MERKIEVTVRALIQRINRRLKPDNRVLKVTRGNGWPRHDQGDFYVIDTGRNFMVENKVDPESYARELGVMAEWEKVAA